MIWIVLLSVTTFLVGWMLGSVRTADYMMRKFSLWMRMSDYDDESIERAVEEVKGIEL